MSFRWVPVAGLLLILNTIQTNGQLEEYFRWKQISFVQNDNRFGLGKKSPKILTKTFSNQNLRYLDDSVVFPQNEPEVNRPWDRREAESYNASNNVPMGVTHYKGHLFVTVPRRRVGITSTLNTINTNEQRGSSPAFRPFPDLKTNSLHPSLEADSNRIISVYRTRVDVCKRLWFVDTGLLEYPGNARQVQRPSLWVFDLQNNRIVRRFEIPTSIVERGNGLASVTVDVQANACDDAFAYIPDLANYRLHVYSFRTNRMWSFQHNYFHFDPHYGDLDVGGVQFQWDDGIFSITLGYRNNDGYRTAYFHPMASLSEFSVSTRVLQTESFANRSYHGSDFVWLGRRQLNTQSAMHDFDASNGVIFYSQVGRNGVSCWNTAKPYRPENHVLLAQNNQTMIYPSDLSVDRDGNLWVFTNTMPRFIYSRLDPNEYNFRIWRASANQLILGTACDNNVNPNTFG